MKGVIQQAGYMLDPLSNIWRKPDYAGIAYSDGDETEQRIAAIISKAADITVLSTELRQHCTDWAFLYHLSGIRANIMRPFENLLQGGDVLEIGAGCGAITRYLGECGANVLALEGSPRRAAIARLRTRDLENVTVLAEKFDQFQCDHRFDVITLIGVLEYANLFTSGENPHLAMLDRLRTLLKPEGKLIIAIENQLGLKYFAGAPEDHIGQPMVGIEGRYRKDQPQTFGRKVLVGMLEQAGFAAHEFLAPFPDYKLPISILTEEGLSNKDFDAAAFAWQSARRDPQLPAYCNFSLELAWTTIFENGLGLDVANSFLIVATTEASPLNVEGVLAYHYSVDRIPDYCKETMFILSDSGVTRVKCRRLGTPNKNTDNANNALIRFNPPDLNEYVFGKPFSLEFINIVTKDNWTFEQVAGFVLRYLSMVESIAKSASMQNSMSSAYAELPGEFFDVIPQNIIMRENGSLSLIDKEWQFVGPIEVGYLLFRSFLPLINSITRFGRPASGIEMTRYQFIDGVFKAVGLRLQEEDYARYIKLEAEVLQTISSVSAINFLNWRKDHLLPILSSNQAINELRQTLIERDRFIQELVTSESWLITKPLRWVGRILRSNFIASVNVFKLPNNKNMPKEYLVVSSCRAQSFFSSFTKMYLEKFQKRMRQARNAFRYVMQGDFEVLIERIKAFKQEGIYSSLQEAISKPRDQICWGIISTHHTQFIACLIADRLQEHGWKVEILTQPPTRFPHDWYVVICSQMFRKIPPGKKRIVFQMEQSVNSRWFTTRYFKILGNSLAVLDYALANIEFLTKKGIAYPHVHYIPVGASAKYGSTISASEKIYDVLFYGDSKSCPRRLKMLEALSQRFNVHVVSEVFGQQMQEIIKQARLVINLHYYEDALLEMPRIQECLSLGVPVLSESAQDQEDYPELLGAVQFFEQGSIPGMLNAVKTALENPVPPEKIAASVVISAKRFAFMIDRFLLAMGFLPASNVACMNLPLPNSVDRVALSLPETISRRRIFETERPVGCVVFDGIRWNPGWVGCGLSYLALAQNAIKQGNKRLNIMEDDVLLPPDFEAKMAVVNEFLDARDGNWDVFVGIIALLHPDAEILEVEKFKDITFVTINKMTSMVFNIYSENALRLLASWNPENPDKESNTIDRFLESQTNLRVVVTLPFFVGHREEVYSTLWGFKNSQYHDLIKKSEQSLQNMILAYNNV